jgi:sugar phosphate isomerase/epimerase
VKIALCDWSLHNEFMKKKISLFDYFKIAKERFRFDAIEFGSWLFESLEDDYLKQLRQAIERHGLRVVNLNVDLGNISQKDDGKRKKDVEMLKGWFRIAKALGSPSFRVNTGNGTDGEDALHRCIASYKELTNLAEKEGIRVLIENHGGLSAKPENIIRIIKEVKSDHLKLTADFGNFAPEIRYEGLAKIAPYIKHAHVKTYEFDAEGLEKTYDIEKCINILKLAGFDGCYGIEFDGKGDEYEGIEKTINLLKRSI